MSFGAPGFLFLLTLVPVALVAIGLWMRWRERARARFGEAAIAGRISRGWIAVTALALSALVLASFAAARPKFGSRSVQVEERGVDVAIVLDVSQSMLSTDAEPTRLGKAQQEIGAMLDRMSGDRAGLVVFGRTAFVRSPVTNDLRAVHTIVDGVDRERGLVEPGSDIGVAILTASKMLHDANGETKIMIVVSDGEDRGQNIPPAIADAKRSGIRVYTVGVGTAVGAPVRDGEPGQLHDRVTGPGAPVVTHLDAQSLQQIAARADGRYMELTGDATLAGLAPEFHSFAQTKFDTKKTPQRIDRFQIFAGLALVLALGTFAVPMLAERRMAMRSLARTWPLLGAGLFVGAICGTGVADVNRHGNSAYNAGSYDKAVAQYRTAEAIDPSHPELFHNAGNAYDRSGDFLQAIEQTRRALDDATAVPGIRPKAEYELGNHFVGNQQLTDAAEAYKRALLADPSDADAKHNLEIIQERLHPSPTPTSTPTAGAPQGTPEANDGSPQSGQNGTPQANATAIAGGTPTGGDTPLTPEEAQRRLDEALQGIDQNFSEEDALRILDLLDKANQNATNQRDAAAGGNPPDY